MRPPATYYGGKASMADTIAGLLPPHTVYVEPFLGSGAVFFAKKPATHEVLNDADGALVAFFRCLRDRPDDLAAACSLTPYARDEHAAADLDAQDLTDLERARRWWVRVSQSFAHSMRGGFTVSTAQNTSRPRSAQSSIDLFAPAARRLLGAVIENMDATDLIARFDGPETVFYVDPPYVATARACTGDYRVEMDDDGHRALAEVLHGRVGKVVLSGYDSPLYEDLYGDWHRVEVDARHTDRTEVLWCNYVPQVTEQMSLAEVTA